MTIDGSLARNIDFEVANLEVHKKTRRKTSILKLLSLKIGGSLARNARFDAPTCLVSSLWFSCGLAVSMGEAPFRRFPSRLSCRFAWQAWHFVTFRRVLYMCRKSFCAAGAILLRRFRKVNCSFRGRRSTLDVSIGILRGRRSALDASCCVFFANRNVRAASSGDKVQIPWQAWHFVRCDEN